MNQQYLQLNFKISSITVEIVSLYVTDFFCQIKVFNWKYVKEMRTEYSGTPSELVRIYAEPAKCWVIKRRIIGDAWLVMNLN